MKVLFLFLVAWICMTCASMQIVRSYETRRWRDYLGAGLWLLIGAILTTLLPVPHL